MLLTAVSAVSRSSCRAGQVGPSGSPGPRSPGLAWINILGMGEIDDLCPIRPKMTMLIHAGPGQGKAGW
jgi:hypothetical protein